MRILKILIILLGLTFFFSISSWAEERTVITEGMAEITGNIVQARELAINDALRTSIEEVVGLIVDSRTWVKNYELIEDSIILQTKGYISNYQVIEEWIEAGVYLVRIEAVIKKNLIEQDIDALQLTIKRSNDPRIMVIIPEKHLHQPIPDPAASTEIIRQLLKTGFKVVDEWQVREVEEMEAFRRALSGDEDAYKELGSEYGADILIIGEAFSVLSSVYYGFYTCQARVEVKVIRIDTGEILAAHGLDEKAVDISEALASKKSLTKEGNKMAEYLIEVLPESLSEVARSLQITIRGISFAELQIIDEYLKKTPLVTGVFIRDFVAGNVRIDVDTSLSPMQLANIVAGWKEVNLEVTGLSGSKIELKNSRH